MANQELVAYLRKHRKQYGLDTLRRKLIEEGLDAGEIDAAIAEAGPKPGAARRKWPYLAAAAAVFVVFCFLVFRNNSSDMAPNPAAPKPTSAGENPNETHQAFLGHYGYVLRLPSGYEALSDFKDPEKTIEEVYLFPKGTPGGSLNDEALYGSLGILRLEVRPRRVPSGRAGLELVRSQVTNSLQQNKVSYSARETMVDGLQAVVIRIDSPAPQVRSFVIGTKVVYAFTSGAESPIFADTLLSLHELAPHDKPGNP